MPTLQLTITMDEAGGVAVTGPIDQRLICYGLLEIARDVVAAHYDQAQRRVQPVSGHGLPPLLHKVGS